MARAAFDPPSATEGESKPFSRRIIFTPIHTASEVACGSSTYEYATHILTLAALVRTGRHNLYRQQGLTRLQGAEVVRIDPSTEPFGPC